MFMEMENIVFFLKACEQFGLHETQLFSCAVRLHRRHHRPAALVLTSSVCVYVCVRALDGPPPGSPLGPRLANSAWLSLSLSLSWSLECDGDSQRSANLALGDAIQMARIVASLMMIDG